MTNSCLSTITACFVVVLLIGAVPLSSANASEHIHGCPLEITEPADILNLALSDTVTFSTFSVDARDTASIIISNNSDCEFPVSLGSYEVYNQNVSDQVLHDQNTKVVQPQSSQLLHVSLPNCMSQIDLLHDPNQDGPPQPPAAANPKLIGWTFQLNNKDTPEENDMLHFSADSQYNELDRFPDDDDDGYSTVPEENRCAATPPLTVSCEVNPSSASTGDAVTWEATDVDGGNGTYNYEWTNDVSGTHKTETATYVEAGNKSGKVTVYSGDQDRSAQCSIDIGGNGGNGGSDFDLTHTGSSMWAISNAQLRSTKTEIKLTKDAGFNNPVTLTASNDVIANSNTMFVHDGDPPQKTVTIQPGEFADSLYLFTDASVPAATYPLIITGESQGGISASTTAPLRVQSYVEL